MQRVQRRGQSPARASWGAGRGALPRLTCSVGSGGGDSEPVSAHSGPGVGAQGGRDAAAAGPLPWARVEESAPQAAQRRPGRRALRGRGRLEVGWRVRARCDFWNCAAPNPSHNDRMVCMRAALGAICRTRAALECKAKYKSKKETIEFFLVQEGRDFLPPPPFLRARTCLNL